jgi:hypothetical protein
MTPPRVVLMTGEIVRRWPLHGPPCPDHLFKTRKRVVGGEWQPPTCSWLCGARREQ